ncbi:MAG: adenylate/guanylate cyclase domain-containing protein [Treponema sp.]|jgi:adenylate cyclase|nr:adenylate/guanylate cyclase domain-containing protein [Treponema sp.]
MNWKNFLTGFAAAVFFSLLYLLGIFDSLEDRAYDLFLRFRSNRERTADVAFLDVDDNAIAYNGVFPWPRSITADALLRLKEYGARAAIFDIEYIDKGPQGVDTIYLNQGLPADFNRSFSEINSAASDIFAALGSGRLNRADINNYAQAFSGIVNDEHNKLFARAQGIARDNDLYLIQASALFGRSWATINLRAEPPFGEQAERRPLAEEHFSYPVKAAPHANKGKFTDILPALPGFALSAQGAGYTNIEIDTDGVRRRVHLAQNVHDHWYLQLAFAPLINYWGRPEIELDNHRLLIKQAKYPNGVVKDIVIPLDGNARMMIDWPKENYKDSYKHISFADFSLLEDLEAGMEQYVRALGATDIPFFARFDSSLARVPFIAGDLAEIFDGIHAVKAAALEYRSEESFAAYMDYRSQSRGLMRELLSIDPGAKVNALLPELAAMFPGNEDAIGEEAGYIANLAEYLKINLNRYGETTAEIENKVRDKFCILGRVDTGTTDMGANPFYGEYINVGTHGVVLDMILSETFILPIGGMWLMLFVLIFVTLFFIASAKLSPVPRAVSGFVITALIITAAAGLFRFTGIYFSPLLAVFAMISAVIVREIISYAGSEREKQFIRKAFSTYVSQDVVKEIIADPSRLQLGGTMRHMSAIFTDIQGFSTISEKLDAEKLVQLLNLYLSAMSDVVLDEKGTIDKYEGDAIIAFFGAPMELPDHALRACLSAITMKQVEKKLNETIVKDGLSPTPLLTRIGINTGSMVAGNMGTGNKMNYTIMGNAVNLAARLEGVNKQYGTWILASDAVIKETGGKILTRRLDRVRVVGINEPVQLHELLNTMEHASPREKQLVTVFHQALDYYNNRKWKEAAQGFRQSMTIENGGPSAKYFKRCETFLTTPPPDTWDGVSNLTEK